MIIIAQDCTIFSNTEINSELKLYRVFSVIVPEIFTFGI